jgi:hypothetical protein
MGSVDHQSVLNPNRVVLTGKTKNQTVVALLQSQPVVWQTALFADFFAAFLAVFFADFFEDFLADFFTDFFTVFAVFFTAFLDAFFDAFLLDFFAAFFTAFAMCKPSPKFCFSRRKRDRVKTTD